MGPFWLVFSESYHKGWRVYRLLDTNSGAAGLKEIATDCTKLGSKSAKSFMQFTLKDIRYLFKKPLDISHQLVNGYANGWYIDPKELGAGDSFTLVIYFLPQSILYLCLVISGGIFFSCIIYLILSHSKNK